ncbi:hypothetical protein HDU96_007633 [Phlyctochytrium bullatum]|nr:hypothetical protein HDU96_007633 [Phlyctochytrium bullatum]
MHRLPKPLPTVCRTCTRSIRRAARSSQRNSSLAPQSVALSGDGDPHHDRTLASSSSAPFSTEPANDGIHPPEPTKIVSGPSYGLRLPEGSRTGGSVPQNLWGKIKVYDPKAQEEHASEASKEFAETVQALKSLKLEDALDHQPKDTEGDALSPKKARGAVETIANRPTSRSVFASRRPDPQKDKPSGSTAADAKHGRRHSKDVSQTLSFSAGRHPTNYEVDWWRARKEDFNFEDRSYLSAAKFRQPPPGAETNPTLDTAQLFVSKVDGAAAAGDLSSLVLFLRREVPTMSLQTIVRSLFLLRKGFKDPAGGAEALYLESNERLLSAVSWRLFLALHRIPKGLRSLTSADWHFLLQVLVFSDANAADPHERHYRSSSLNFVDDDAHQVDSNDDSSGTGHAPRKATTPSQPSELEYLLLPPPSTRAMFLFKEMKAAGTVPDDRAFSALVRTHHGDPKRLAAIHRRVQELSSLANPQDGVKSLAASAALPVNPSRRGLRAIPFTDFYARQYLHSLLSLRPVVVVPKAHGDALSADAIADAQLAAPKPPGGSGYRYAARESMVENLWQEMREVKAKPSRITCVGFLDAFARARDKVMVENVHRALLMDRKAKDGEGPWSREIYLALMKAHQECGNYLAVERLFLDMVEKDNIEPDQPFLLILMQSLHKRELHKEVRRCFLAMNSNRIPVTDQILSMAIKSLAALHDTPTLHALHDRLNDLVPPVVAASDLLGLDGGDGHHHHPDEDDEHKAVTSVPYIDLVQAYAGFRDIEWTMKAYNDLKARRTGAIDSEDLLRLFEVRLQQLESRAGEGSIANDDDHYHHSEDVDDVEQERSPDTEAQPHFAPPEPDDAALARAPATTDPRLLVPRKSLADVAAALAHRGHHASLEQFLHAELLDPFRLAHHWHRIATAHARRRLRELAGLRVTFDQVVADAAEQGAAMGHRARVAQAVSKKRLTHLGARIDGLRREVEAGPGVRVGFEGPFGAVYGAVDRAWREWAEGRVEDAEVGEGGKEDGEEVKPDVSEKLMALEEMVDRLVKREAEVVREVTRRLGIRVKWAGRARGKQGPR